MRDTAADALALLTTEVVSFVAVVVQAAHRGGEIGLRRRHQKVAMDIIRHDKPCVEHGCEEGR